MSKSDKCVLCGSGMNKVKERVLADRVRWGFYRCTGCDNQLWIPLASPRVVAVQLPFYDLLFDGDAAGGSETVGAFG